MMDYLTTIRLKFIKKELRKIFPDIKSAKLTELLAHGYGYKSHSALLSSLKNDVQIPVNKIISSNILFDKKEIHHILHKSRKIYLDIPGIKKQYKLEKNIDKTKIITGIFIYNDKEHSLLWNDFNGIPKMIHKNRFVDKPIYLPNKNFFVMYEHFMALSQNGWTPLKIIHEWKSNIEKFTSNIGVSLDVTCIILSEIERRLRIGQNFIESISPFINPCLHALYQNEVVRTSSKYFRHPKLYYNFIYEELFMHKKTSFRYLKDIWMYIDLFNIHFDNIYPQKYHYGDIELYKTIACTHNIHVFEVFQLINDDFYC